MESAAPIIYPPSERLSLHRLGARVLALVFAGGCLAVLIIAAKLEPSRLGYGTHRELGMPDCQFLHKFGVPCPGCGMTTSFAWFVRGNVVASFYVQPMGAVLAALCCCTIWAGLYFAVTGRPVYRLLELAPGQYLLIPLGVIAIAAWIWKILIHLSGHDGW